MDDTCHGFPLLIEELAGKAPGGVIVEDLQNELVLALLEGHVGIIVVGENATDDVLVDEFAVKPDLYGVSGFSP
ncbi:hypothetical protein ACFL5Z_15405 [Planctomycetota bacterium]